MEFSGGVGVLEARAENKSGPPDGGVVASAAFEMVGARQVLEFAAWVPIAEALGLASVSDGGEGRLFDVYSQSPAVESASVGEWF